MATLFRSGDGESADKIIIALEVPNDGWFKRNLIGALELMCNQENWTATGTATTDFARDKSNEMLENVEIDVIIPVLPVGTIQMFGGVSVPTKWRSCDGQSILRADYPDLFAAIGTIYGSVDGTHFNLPNFRDFSPIGWNAGGTNQGVPAGSMTHTLTTAELPAHNHGVTDPGHIHTASDSGHAHTQQIGNNVTMKAFVAGGSGTLTPAGAATSSGNNMVTGAGTAIITVASHTTGISTNNAGGGSSHSILHPVLPVMFMIYAGF